MVYEEASTRRIAVKTIVPEDARVEGQTGVFRHDREFSYVIRRTVAEVSADGVPSRESVEVLKAVVVVHAAPNDKTGTTERPSQGKTFELRRGKDGSCALYEGDEDVTKKHDDIVQRLRSRSALRLPPAPVAVGATWEVPARAFEESEGRIAPEGIDGKAVFKLEEVKDDVARVTFEIELSFVDHGQTVRNKAKGVWLIDVARGRELKLEGEGKLEIADARGGFGTQKMSRELTYR
jgi:hypothetical protein